MSKQVELDGETKAAIGRATANAYQQLTGRTAAYRTIRPFDSGERHYEQGEIFRHDGTANANKMIGNAENPNMPRFSKMLLPLDVEALRLAAKCDRCEKVFAERGFIARHIAEAHTPKPVPVVEPFRKFCRQCAVTFEAATLRELDESYMRHWNRESPPGCGRIEESAG